MRSIECDAADVSERHETTTRGYRRFRCRACGKQFNERNGGILNRAQYPSDVIALVIFWRLRYKLSLRDLPEMFLIRGTEFSYEAVRDGEAKLTPTLIDNLRRRRKWRIGKSWYVDEAYTKVNGRWCYLYRAIDRSGALVDVRLSEKRDMAAAKAFFRSAKAVTDVTPARVTTEGHDSYPRAILRAYPPRHLTTDSPLFCLKGRSHHIAGPHLGQYAGEMAWREDMRRDATGAKFGACGRLALGHPPSPAWTGYWQRHRRREQLRQAA